MYIKQNNEVMHIPSCLSTIPVAKTSDGLAQSQKVQDASSAPPSLERSQPLPGIGVLPKSPACLRSLGELCFNDSAVFHLLQ